ncbi:hypothetical protein [Cesiribacter andamanensis]|uniref:Uncharacterized protein n=1 Tax=Cesiribacter andamanensis AMV16 TaxID=1279009 RepID=M7N996_9BACT|nr:hypothetical protein [Cesiribacter andamanensis]EMR03822.1 hypothetical protein ADICEAN_01065 [Cesiribacter andamanensis AMV16]
MKKNLLALLLLLLLSSLAQAQQETPLQQALAQNMVTLSAQAAGGLGRQNLQLKIRSLLKRQIRLRIPPGLHFKAQDSGAQDLFTATEDVLVLEAGAEKLVSLQGFCMNASRYAPAARGVYHFQGLASPSLKVLGDTLARYPPLAEEWGQMFVWAITDGRGLYPVYVDSAFVRPATSLMAHAAAASGQASAGVHVKAKESRSPTVTVFFKKGVLAFHNPTDQRASFILCDAQGNKKWAYYENQPLSHGLKHYTFGVNEIVAVGDEPVYWAKVISESGRVLAQMKVDRHTEARDVQPSVLSFTFQFELRQPVRRASLTLYLQDGTLVEEFKRYSELGIGAYDLHIQFLHLHKTNTPFVAKLLGEDGRVLAQQLVKSP